MTTETVPCKVCGEPTDKLGTQLCDPCWELARRIQDGIRRGVVKKLHLAPGHFPEGIRLNDKLSREIFGYDR